MELARILRELWRLRIWLLFSLPVSLYVGLSSAYNVSLAPPSLQKKAIEVGTASTELLVDSPRSALIDAERSIESWSSRAEVYASLIDSEVIRGYIGRAVGLPDQSIVTSGPSVINQPTRERNAQQRGNEIIAESRLYRVAARSRSGLPLVSIATQAPSAERPCVWQTGRHQA